MNMFNVYCCILRFIELSVLDSGWCALAGGFFKRQFAKELDNPYVSQPVIYTPFSHAANPR